MKNWNAPVLEELDVNVTANGRRDFYVETRDWLFSYNDSKVPKPDPDPDPEKTES